MSLEARDNPGSKLARRRTEPTLGDYADQSSLFPPEELYEPSVIDVQGSEDSTEGARHCEDESAIDIDVNSIWVTQENGEQLHLRHFRPQLCAEVLNAAGLVNRLAELPGLDRRVFMLHGEAESGRVYYDNSSKGLAWYLARQGYEVFVADLGGRGRSLVAEGEMSTLSVHQLIESAIPRLLQAIANTPAARGEESRFGCAADIWVGHGFGTVLLAAAWAQLPGYLRSAQQMIFFSGRRRVQSRSKLSRLFVGLIGHPLMRRWVARCNRFPARKLGIGTANENVGWYLNYLGWMNSQRWIGEDGFDYAASLAQHPLPPILHLAALHDSLYADLDDVRAFIDELGPHDARLQVYDTVAGTERNYNHLSMLLDESAAQQVFPDLAHWLIDTGDAEYFHALPAVGATAVSRDDVNPEYAQRVEHGYPGARENPAAGSGYYERRLDRAGCDEAPAAGQVAGEKLQFA